MMAVLVWVSMLTFSEAPGTQAFSASDVIVGARSGFKNNNNRSIALSQQLSDRILSQEYYKSVYKGVPSNKQQQQQGKLSENKNDTGRRSRTPWDIGNNRPQPAIVRAYEQGKLRGHILDAGCGAGENCLYLAGKYGVRSVTGFDLSPDAVQIGTDAATSMLEEQQNKKEPMPFWTTPRFLASSCTEVADRHSKTLLAKIANDNGDNHDEEDNRTTSGDQKQPLFDTIIDSGLLHCLSHEDATAYVRQMAKLLEPTKGRFFIGCFSDANPDPWDNPRRISEEYLRNELFADCASSKNEDEKVSVATATNWEVVSCDECWWARPPSRGSSTGGAFSLALWVEVRRVVPNLQ